MKETYLGHVGVVYSRCCDGAGGVEDRVQDMVSGMITNITAVVWS